jgi:hypothetical protein
VGNRAVLHEGRQRPLIPPPAGVGQVALDVGPAVQQLCEVSKALRAGLEIVEVMLEKAVSLAAARGTGPPPG